MAQGSDLQSSVKGADGPEPAATTKPNTPTAPLTRSARLRGFAGRHWGKGLLLLTVVAVAVAAGPRWLLGPLVPVDRVVQRDFVQTVVATGRVETPHRVSVAVQITGTVLRVPVSEGQNVGAGDLLFELESTEQRANTAQAQSAALQARARLRQLREVQAPGAEQALREAQANHETLRSALARSRELVAQGFIGQAALDEAQRAERVSQARVNTAQQQLASARPDGSDTAIAQAALAQAQAGAEAAQARLRYASVRAPVAGTLIKRDVEPGDGVQPGKVLMVLSPVGETQLVVQIDERNLRLVRVGLPALASADAYPGETFAAEVVYINPGVDAQRGAVEVKLRVAQPPPTLKADMTVSVDVEVARRAAAVLVPTAALHDAESAAPWVLKVDGRHVRRQPLQLGLRSNGLVEVLQGLRAGDQVVPATALTVKDGQRLRAVAPDASASAPASTRQNLPLQ